MSGIRVNTFSRRNLTVIGVDIREPDSDFYLVSATATVIGWVKPSLSGQNSTDNSMASEN